MYAKALIGQIRAKTNNRCWYCGKYLQLSPWEQGDRAQATVDHVIPVKRGGSDGIENLVPCCKSCNSTKHEDTIEIFRWRMTYKDNNIPPFNKEQINYLNKCDFKFFLPNGIYKFHFEKEGLTS